MRIVIYAFGRLFALLIVCFFLLPAFAFAQGKPDESAVEELRRLIEKQQQIIEAQQRRLEALEKQFAELDNSPTTPKPSKQATPSISTQIISTQISKEITREGFGIKFYGFLRGDLAADTDRMSFDTQLPFFALSPADPSQARAQTGDLTAHPRLTRFGVDVIPPELPSGWRALGKLEIDLYNVVIDRPSVGGPLAKDLVSNSRAVPRLRLAYVQVSRGDFSFLGGQTWDVISPLIPSYNPEVLMWNGGNPGDRRPQFRLAYDPKIGKGKLSIIGAIGASGAIDGQDLDGDGFRDGEASATPTGQLRVGYSAPLLGQTWSFGFWLHGARQQLNRNTMAGRDDFSSSLLGVDFSLPIVKNLSIKGEVWKGRGLADVRGGVGQSVNAVTGQVIRAAGGWAELSFIVNSHYTVSAGTALDSPYAEDISAANGRVRNGAHYITNRFTVGGGLSFGFDYGRWQTRYKALPTGSNNRFNLFLQQTF